MSLATRFTLLRTKAKIFVLWSLDPFKKKRADLCDNTKSTLYHQPSVERMTIMANYGSATARETSHASSTETPQATETNSTTTISDALKRRAQSVINDDSIDGRWRAVIRYALETDDPWLADLVRRADDGEPIVNTVDFSLEPRALESDFSEDRIEALAEIICRTGEESAAARQSTARSYSASPGSDRGSRYLRSLS